MMDSEQRAREILAEAVGRSLQFIEALGDYGFCFTKQEAINAVARALEQREAGHRPECNSRVPIEIASCCQPAAPASEAGSKGREGERVEAAAEAIHAMQREDGTVNDWNWADLSERYKDEYRRMARAALAAKGE